MADREALRQIVLSKTFRRTIFGALLLLAIWFVWASLSRGSVADRCADELSAAVAKRDTAYLAKHVKNPSLERALSTSHAELAFVRPVDSEWSRIGFLLKSSPTATAAKPLFVLLSHEQSATECSFIQDYDHL